MKKIIVFSGAGLSKESGIPTFRDSADGLWHNHKIEDVAEHQSYWKNKELVLNFFAARMENVNSCDPNEAHFAIAELQSKYEVINITQNIDNLLERAGCKDVWHLHGKIHRKKCEKHKNILTYSDGFKCDYEEDCDVPVKIGDVCSKCGSQLRPDIVLFHEAVDMRESLIKNLMETVDIFIGVGTSAVVSPAANLIYMFRHIPMKFWVDPEPASRLKSFGILKGKASEKLPLLKNFLLELE